MKINNLTLGSDIEYFLRDKKTKEVVSAEGIIRGTKDEPFKFVAGNKFFATSLDNVSAEGNIPPVKTAYEFYKNVAKLINYINATIPANLEAIAMPSARLDEKYLQTDNAKHFGCDPSWNCWTLEEIRPQPTGDNLRACGYHIHMGYDNPSEEANYALIKACDLFLGVPSILIEPENERKQVGYGCAGNMRHTQWGAEYRTLSSFFSSNKRLITWTFKNTKKAVDFVNNNRINEIEGLGDIIQQTINNSNRELAENLIKDFQINLV